MPDVTCPNCWLWQPIGRSTRCSACGAPLITPAGVRVDQASAPPAPEAAGYGFPPPGYPGGPPVSPVAPAPGQYGAWAPAGYPGMFPAESPRGTDWVLWVRIAIAVPSLLLAVLLMLLGLLVRHVTLPASAGSVPQTVNLGPTILVVVVVMLAITALIVWLAQFAVTRLVLLVLVVISVVSVLGQISAAPSADRIAILTDLGWEVVYGALLILSLVSPRPRPR